MSIHPILVATARKGWHWQWHQLMNGLAPADAKGNYCRPKSQHLEAKAPNSEYLTNKSQEELPRLIIGRSCPWAHRTWLVYKLRGLNNHLNLLIVTPNYEEGRWKLDQKWLGCNSLEDLYKICNSPPEYRATVPVIIDPAGRINQQPKILGNESTQLVEALNLWPSSTKESLDLAPKECQTEIAEWGQFIQPYVNNGVYRCGFARTQYAYDQASTDLFNALEKLNTSLEQKGPWLCGEKLTLADVRLFPTLIRWELIYMPLFGCSKEPLWAFENVWNWRKKFLNIPGVAETCNSIDWRNDYFGALFPLRPSNIVPAGPNLVKIVNSKPPKSHDRK